ncbi:uncharacterized protein VTP21DRAFT_1640 [Calcarisporiella thermophila]|uniref:uncharacterized protein n=1 Tax=Calcarisporiella thermophila TaxID=911321 RepID=UPI0037444860
MVDVWYALRDTISSVLFFWFWVHLAFFVYKKWLKPKRGFRSRPRRFPDLESRGEESSDENEQFALDEYDDTSSSASSDAEQSGNEGLLPLARHKITQRQHSRMPFSASRSTSASHSSSSVNTPSKPRKLFSLRVKPFYVRVTTTRLNSAFLRAVAYAPRFWEWWFAAGVVFGGVALVVGVCVLGWAALKLVGWMMNLTHLATVTPPAARRLAKRAMADLAQGDGQVFVPVIPGITLPLSHMGYYVFALLFSTLIHEAGHAIAAASERVHINNTGVFLLVLYPGAFVDLSSRALSILTPLRKLKIICAGVWHNIVLYVVCWVFLTTLLRPILLLCGWQEVTDGVVVTDIAKNSALHHHLPPSSVILRVDDVILADPLNSWTKLLVNPHNESWASLEGFCVPKSELEAAGRDLSCCQVSHEHPFGHSKNESITCFESFRLDKPPPRVSYHDAAKHPVPPPLSPACLPALSILSSTTTPTPRCISSENCPSDHACMTPYTPYYDARAIRLYFREHLSEPDAANVLVYFGDPGELWSNVQVSDLQPRASFLPVGLPRVLELAIGYTASFTSALSVLNALPAFGLDGSHALGDFIKLFRGEDGGGFAGMGGTREQGWRRVERAVTVVVTAVVGWVVLGSVVVGIVGTSG